MENDARRYLRTLSNDELVGLIHKLGRYAARKSKNYRWRSGNHTDLPKGETIDSIVSLAIELVLQGKRNWNPDNHPDFAEFLMDVIDSRLFHLATGLDNKINSRIPAEADFSNLEPALVTNPITHRREQTADWLSRKPRTPEEELIEKEIVRQEMDSLKELEEAIKEDVELVAIFVAIKEGCETDKEISEFTGIDIVKVRAAKKRMARRINTVREKFSEI